MEIVRVAFARSRKQLSREDFCEQLRRILAEQFPDETVERVTPQSSRTASPLSSASASRKLASRPPRMLRL